MDSLPEIDPPLNEIKISSEIKPQSPEPEVEECCEDNQIKEIVESLGLDYEKIAQIKSAPHIFPPSDCLHCKLTEKVKSLKQGIDKLSLELETTEEILKAKKSQNKDIKGIIETLESIANTESSFEGTATKTCSCSTGCQVM
jgi:hypothetical protein